MFHRHLQRRHQQLLCAAVAKTLLLFIDGIRTVDFRALEYIPAKSIFRIDILNGIEGTTYYGTNAVGGVILVQTKNGSET